MVPEALCYKERSFSEILVQTKTRQQHSDERPIGQLGSGALGQLGSWALVELGYWTLGLMVSWSVGHSKIPIFISYPHSLQFHVFSVGL
jgi:hypothetical protein